MPDLTTAQRLAAYREELLSDGFSDTQAWQLVERIAPSRYEDLEVASDLEESPAKMGAVTVYMLPKVDKDSLVKVAEEIRWSLQAAIRDEDQKGDQDA
ncbi:hypothetical protein [Sphaerisporangium sp. TRM90804]|uniref:hypothetical protein n=1 Tax=Sphaerisporangium sp. TRM90804 TaxID=3031113 RepID=UPI00244D32A3|nr:hypothetical protein [Sphaerisporangium sp. TRM90804]MDH2424753.1 hypothetical protein [Sphaerisporangium sp. TRM90804]